MKRAILTPAVPPPSSLAELKDWLGVATTQDDAGLSALLRAALETCEAFTGIVPVAMACEEVLPGRGGWQVLATVPVQAITGVAAIATDGTRTALAPGAYEADLDAGGTGLVRIASGTPAMRVAVSFTAGLAPDWASLPDGMRHGIMRLAAHGYRQRDSGEADAVPPASVAALWRPWRRLRLA